MRLLVLIDKLSHMQAVKTQNRNCFVSLSKTIYPKLCDNDVSILIQD